VKERDVKSARSEALKKHKLGSVGGVSAVSTGVAEALEAENASLKDDNDSLTRQVRRLVTHLE
jgi:cell division protein FtsB